MRLIGSLLDRVGLRRVPHRPRPVSPEAVALLQDAIDHPHEEGYLRVYADWLEDHAQPDRADFIRAQLDRMSAGDPEMEVRCLRREAELRAQHEPAWWSELPRWPGVTWVDFERGLPQAIVRDPAILFRLVAERIPCWITLELRTDHAPLPDLLWLIGAPIMQRVTGLSIAGPWRGDDLIRALCSSPVWSNLLTLRTDFQRLGDPGALALAQSPHLSRLRTLALNHDEIGPAGLEGLLRAGWAPQLRELSLTGNPIGPDLKGIALKSATPCLRRLSLAHARLDGPSLAGLLHNIPSGLCHLNVTGNGLGLEAGEILAAAPSLLALTELRLGANRLGDEGLAALLQGPKPPVLRVLDCRLNRIGDTGARRLAESSWLGGLRRLDLSSNLIGNAGAEVLAARLATLPGLDVDLSLNNFQARQGGWFGWRTAV